jgi:hypothetical protein
VVVDQFNVIDLPVAKPENNTPVGSDRNRPKTFPVALERVKMKAGEAHIVNGGGFIQLDEDRSNPRDQIGANPRRIVLFKEPL